MCPTINEELDCLRKKKLPRRLVQFWHIFQISLVVLITNFTPSRVITYTNPETNACELEPVHMGKSYPG
jgi:hypothetical protein